jgi:hypothetical protein
MPVRGDRDILLPEERGRIEVLGRLRSILRGFRQTTGGTSPKQAPPEISPTDLWGALEYLVGEYEVTGILHEDLADTLAAKFADQAGQARFDLQCRLAAALADRTTVRFHVSLRVAAHVPVPQARTALLQMLTQPDLAYWSSLPATASTNGTGLHGHDLRPAVIAALGRLRDPSLLGLFHRLLEKLSAAPAGQEKVIAAVQWSLMNLAPGGSGEPVPAAILSTTRPEDHDPAAAPAGAAPAADDTSTAEALRVVAAVQARTASPAASPGGNGAAAAATKARPDASRDAPAGASERSELLSGF